MTPQEAQKIQDEIFRNMSADRKLEIASQLWQLGQELNKMKDGDHRSKKAARGRRQDSERS